MEIEMLRGEATEEKTNGGEDRGDHRRQAALELASVLAEARRVGPVGRTPIKEGNFRRWQAEFRKRLHGLEVVLEPSRAFAVQRAGRARPFENRIVS